MKKSRKFATFAASVLAVACMAVPLSNALPVYAEDHTVSFSNSDDATHTYAAYQIFSGDYSGGTLTNIVWGSGVNSTNLLSALKTNATIGSLFNNCTEAKDVAAVLGNSTNFAADSTNAQIFADIVGANLTTTTAGTTTSTNTTLSLGDGYYLIQDSAAPTTATNGSNSGAMTRYVLQVVGENVQVTTKNSAPSVEKKVLENTHTITNGDASKYGDAKYNDVADYCIGDSVPFLLYGTLPSTYSDYDHYYYKFTDTLATGLTAPSASDVHVKIGGTEYTGANVNINGQTITVEILDVKTASASATKDSVITVEYNATLNANAVIGLDGNENEVYLTYSNNPNNTGDGTAAPSDTGTTVKDKVIVFTYELDATKVDASDNTPLANATFYLKRANASLTSDNDKYEYAKLDDNYKVTGWTTTKESATLLTSRDTADSLKGTFKVIGLDDATYYLEEVTAPTGYNKLTADVPVVISATTANNQAWSGTASAALTALSVSVNENANASAADGTLSDGNVKVTIKNSKGSTLPTTGGIGTTIFYVGGGVVVAGAGVLLVTKKRMRNK